MGAYLCSKAHAAGPREALRFHEDAKGAQVLLDARGCTACRRATFHDGIVFSQRPVSPGERVALRVLRQEGGWCGGLRVGFTRLDPARVSAPSLPPFVCPDLEERSPTWAAVLPEGCVLPGNVVCFWVNRRGRLFAKVNAGRRFLLRKDLLMGAPLWAVMDVYGTTKAIQLLGETADPTADLCLSAMPAILSEEAVPEPEATPSDQCVICFYHATDTYLVPCGHSYFCSSCAQRVFRDTARCPVCRWQIEAIAAICTMRTGEGS